MDQRAKILIVDDEESIRFTFEIFLAEAGYDVTTARSYKEGLAVLDQEKFDLILTDIILGGKTGLDLVREIRRRSMSCPVVIFTGFPSGESASDAARMGVVDYLVKPVRMDKLLQVTRDALSRK